MILTLLLKYNNTLLTDGQENINGENLNAPLLSANFHTGVSETLNVFEIKQRVEFGRMSELFLGKVGQKIFYAVLIVSPYHCFSYSADLFIWRLGHLCGHSSKISECCNKDLDSNFVG